MARGNKSIDIKVRYVPDISLLDKELKDLSKIDFKFGDFDLKSSTRSLLEARKGLKDAFSGGTSIKGATKAFANFGSEIDRVRDKLNQAIKAEEMFFNGSANQENIKALKEFERQYVAVQRKIDAWNKKYSKQSLKSYREQTGVADSAQDRQKLIKEFQNRVVSGQDTQDIKALYDATSKYNDLLKEMGDNPKKALEEDLSHLREQISMLQERTLTEEQHQAIQLQGLAAQSAVNNSIKENTNVTDQNISAIKSETEAIKEGTDRAREFASALTASFAGFTLSNTFQTALRQAISFYKDYDAILTRTMMVTTMSRDEVNKLTASYNDMARSLSSTTKDVASAQLIFYQQGLNTREAAKMTEAAIAVSKTGGIEAAEAADRLTSAVRGYQLSANEAMSVVDKMSALDARAASSVDELTIAMQKSASQARMAGLDLDYYMAYLSTMQEVTREAPENIGTAMKSITSRLQEIKDLGKVEEDGTTFSNVAKALNSIGIAALDSAGQLRSLQDIMNELGPMWSSLDRNHKAYIATVMAGNRQQSRFIALMDNYDRALELVNVSQNAAGEHTRQLNAYNTGLEASLVRLSNAWQQIATAIGDSSVITSLVNSLSSLLEILTSNDITKAITRWSALFLIFKKIYPVYKDLKTLGLQGIVRGLLNIPNTIPEEKIQKTWGQTFLDKLELSGSKQKQIVNSFKKTFDTIVDHSQEMASKVIEGENAVIDAEIAAGEAFESKATSSSVAVGAMQNVAVNAEATAKQEAVLSDEAKKAAKEETTLSESLRDVKKSLDDDDASMEKEAEQNRALGATAEGASTETTNLILLQKQQVEAQKAADEALSELNKIKQSESYSSSIWKQNLTDFVNDPKRYEAAKKEFKETFGYKGKITKDEVLVPNLNDYMKFDSSNPDFRQWLMKESSYFEETRQNIKYTIEEFEEAYNRAVKALEGITEEIHGIQNNGTSVTTPSNLIGSEISKENNIEIDLKDVVEEVQEDVKEGTDLVVKNVTDPNNKNSIPRAISRMLDSAEKTFKGTVGKPGLKNVISGAFGSFITGQIVGSISQSVLSSVSNWMNPQGNGYVNPAISRGIGDVATIGSAFSKGMTTGVITTGLLLLYRGMNKYSQAVEDAEEKYAKLSETWSKTKENVTEIKSIISVYDKLGNKIVKTTEEQEELNDAIEKMKEIAPEAIVGYDTSGNPIVNKNALKNAEKNYLIENANSAKDAANAAAELAGATAKKETTSAWQSFKENILPWVLAIQGTGQILWGHSLTGSNSITIGQRIKNESIASSADERSQAIQTEFTKITDTMIQAAMSGVEEGLQDGDDSTYNLREQISDTIARQYWRFTTKVASRAAKEGDFTGTEAEKVAEEFLTNSKNAINKLNKTGGLEDLGDLAKYYEDLVRRGESWNNIKLNFQKSSTRIMSKAGLTENEAGVIRDALRSQIFADFIDPKEIADKIAEAMDELDKNDISRKSYGIVQAMFNKSNMNAATASAINSTGLLDDVADKDAIEIVSKLSGYIDEVNKSAYNLDGTLNTEGATIALVTALQKELNKEQDPDKVKKYKDTIEELIDSLPSPDVWSFTEIGSNIEELIKDFNTLTDVIETLNEQGGKLDLDTFTSLVGTLDAIGDAALKDFNNIDQYTAAFNALADGISVVNGEMYLNAEAVEQLAEIKRLAFINDINQQIAEVEAAKSATEMQLALIEIEIQSLLEGLDDKKTAAENEAEIERNLDNALLTFNEEYLNSYADNLSNYVASTSAALQKAGSLWAKYLRAIATNDYASLEGSLKKLDPSSVLNEITGNWKTSVTDSLKDAVKLGDAEFQNYVKNRIDTLRKNKKYYEDVLSQYNDKLGLLSGLKDVAETGLGSLQKFAKGAEDAASDYNERLKETLSLLEKIERIAHKLEENEAFENFYDKLDGAKAGEILVNDLDLYKQQYELYKDLFDMQQRIVNQAAGDLLDSPFGELFNILDNGAVTWADETSYYKYISLNDEAKESIDNLVEAFQSERDSLEETEISLQGYVTALSNTRDKIRDLTISAEQTILNAVKNREKILHEARVKAYQDEISMIEKAVDARNKANSRDQQYKELYQAQEKLRRATLDSSGKNNSTLLQLQQDLEDKLLEIQEQRFSDDMDDRKQWLQDSKDAETESYEYRLETMTWYWEEVTRIMEGSTEEIMRFLVTWEEEYRTESATAREKLLEEWESTFSKLKKIADMGESLEHLKEEFKLVADEVYDMDIKVQALAGRYKELEDAANKAATATGKVGNGGSSYTRDSNNNDNNNDKQLSEESSRRYPSLGATTMEAVGKKMQQGDSIEFRPEGDRRKVVDVFDAAGNKIGTYQNGIFGDKNGTAGEVIRDSKSSRVYFAPAKGYINTWYFQVPGTWGENDPEHRYYSSGGMVDYTGPAWVDGSYSKPEAFLNPYQTQQIGALANALSSNSISAISGDSNITFGSINFNVASMSSAADGKKALEAFVQGANDMMAKKGIGTKLNLNVR